VKLSLSEEALAGATQAADGTIDQGAWTAAAALQVEMADAPARIAADPGLGTPGSEATRILRDHRFQVSRVHRVDGAELRVIAAAAQRGRPGHWAGRC
jgi:plasmid stabilization system protein ParE